MDAFQFKAAWERGGDTLLSFPEEQLAGATLPAETKEFLKLAGLPQEAAPCLAFGPSSLRWAAREAELASFNNYFPVGSDGSGNPLVIAQDGSILLLDHDRRFEPIYVNKDVQTLAACLLSYRASIDEAAAAGAEAFYGEVPMQALEQLANEFSWRDPPSVSSGSMWAGELLIAG